jgi:phosphoserine aminotransferase
MTAITAPTKRITNFSAGPACLPLEVVEEARDNLLSLGDSGLGIMEISHRSKAFRAIMEEAEANIRELLSLSDDWAVLFLTGGAQQQFFQVPMNLLPGKTATYLDTGAWSSKAIKQAQRFGEVHVGCSSKDDNYTHIPKNFTVAPGSAYLHYTSNNTIFGTQYKTEPTADCPLVCDASSDIFSREIDVEKYGLIYAGAQKNAGTAGTTLVMIRKDFAEQGVSDIPELLQYRQQIEQQSMYNTSPTFPIYVSHLVMRWLKTNGGVAAMETRNKAKADAMYALLDSSDFYTTPVAVEDRSTMNPVFRLANTDLEPKLIEQATAAGFDGVKGHRSVGGLRVSMYNAITLDEVEAFCSFLRDFEQKNG